MKTPEEIHDFFINQLAGVIEPLERKRQEVSWLLFILYGSVSVVAGILLLVWGLMILNIVAFISVLIVVVLHRLIVKDFVSSYKNQVISKIIRFINPALSYHPHQYMPQEVFTQSQLFEHQYNSYSGADLIKGEYGGIDLTISELALKRITHGSSKRRQVVEIFKGLCFMANFHKSFQGMVLVCPDHSQSLGAIGEWLQSLNVSKGQLVKLEDPEFEQLFVVYSDDQIKARYVLTTSLMQRLVAFRRKTKNEIFISFVQGKIYLALRMNRDYLEPTLFKSLMSIKSIEEYVQQIYLMLDIVEDLKLNTNIWQ